MARGKTRSRAEWQQIINDYAASGKTQTQYAPIVGCHPTTLGWWLRRRKELFGEPETPTQTQAECRFIELREDTNQTAMAATAVGVSVTTKAGTVIRFDSMPSPVYLAKLCQIA